LTAERPAVTDAKAGPEEPRPQVFRSPIAIVVWWAWLLFAIANLIDLAVQGRQHASAVAAAILVLATGAAYVAARRPRIIAASGGLTVRNPLRDHQISWGSVVKVDTADLVRVHCEWPLDTADHGTDQPAVTGQRVIHAWAVHSSRRRQATAQMRAAGRGGRTGRGYAGGGYARGGYAGDGYAAAPGPPHASDADQVVRALGERATQEAGTGARPPVSSWYWPGVAAVVIPAIALLLVALL
jgi:Bacterial PH domain